MTSRLAIASLLSVGLSLFLTIAAQAQLPAYRSGELLVRFKTPARADALSRSADRHGIRALRSISNGDIQHLSLPPGMDVEEALSLYRNDPDVAFAEPNFLLTPQKAPNDPDFEKQWGLHNEGQVIASYSGTAGADINLLQAWALTKENSETVVAVVDTGCNLLHPDLAGKLWTNPDEIAGNGIDDDGNGYVDDIHGWDFADYDNSPQDVTGHGTHVAGIIAAQSSNGIGISGIGRRTTIMPLRFMNAFDSGTVADAISAIDYATNKGVRIINCSWGSPGNSASLHHTMSNADALFICAAGNSGSNNDTTAFYPASFPLPNLLSVTASDQQDALAGFSNIGLNSVHVAAPGVRIFSLGLSSDTMMAEDFEKGFPYGWQTGGTNNLWAVEENVWNSNSKALAVSGTGAYGDNAEAWAMMPPVDLGDASASQLSFLIVGASEPDKDHLYVEASTKQSQWLNLPVKVGGSIKESGISGSIPYWTMAEVDLGPLDGNDTIFVRFRFKSNATITQIGFFIDNIEMRVASDEESYQFMSGTSMAAAFVSGIAAMLSGTGDIDALTMAAFIEQGVDFSDDLTDKIATGGRVNAYNSLILVHDNTSDDDAQMTPAADTGGGGGGGCFITLLTGAPF